MEGLAVYYTVVAGLKAKKNSDKILISTDKLFTGRGMQAGCGLCWVSGKPLVPSFSGNNILEPIASLALKAHNYNVGPSPDPPSNSTIKQRQAAPTLALKPSGSLTLQDAHP